MREPRDSAQARSARHFRALGVSREFYRIAPRPKLERETGSTQSRRLHRVASNKFWSRFPLPADCLPDRNRLKCHLRAALIPAVHPRAISPFLSPWQGLFARSRSRDIRVDFSGRSMFSWNAAVLFSRDHVTSGKECPRSTCSRGVAIPRSCQDRRCLPCTRGRECGCESSLRVDLGLCGT